MVNIQFLAVNVFLPLFLIFVLEVRQAYAQEWKGQLSDTIFPQDESGFFFSFGGLAPEELYWVYYNGAFAGVLESNSQGALNLPILGPYSEVQVLQFPHSESSVGNWDQYD